jgi:hypothetical protein
MPYQAGLLWHKQAMQNPFVLSYYNLQGVGDQHDSDCENEEITLGQGLLSFLYCSGVSLR